MTTVELITALFYEVDEQMGAIPKHPEALLWPSEVVTLGPHSSWVATRRGLDKPVSSSPGPVPKGCG
jgi:hypothetical protein